MRVSKSPKKNKKNATVAPLEEEINEGDRDFLEEGTHSDDEEGGFRIGDIYIPPPPRSACTVESTGPRLIITKIENIDFKSYGGKRTLGPFHKCFTSIVGPNGSGKSNVIDSMLFVFGYRASKIRSKKISVLLHNSDQRHNVDSCTVTVYFQLIIDKEDDPDAYEMVPNSEIAVSRTAFKDNSSYYKINDRRVQFKEVAKLLRGHGIDLDHNRFLILQGEVEQIAMMKPKGQNDHETGMLEFLEDIIGTTRFKEPIEKMAVKVEELNQQRTEKLTRVKIVEKEKEDLEGPKNDAVRFISLENDITELRNTLHQVYQWQDQQKLSKKLEEKRAKEEVIAGIKEEMATVSAVIDKQRDDIKDMLMKKKVLYQHSEELRAVFKEVSTKDVCYQENIKSTSNKRKKTRELLAGEKTKLTQLEAVPDDNKKKITELEAKEESLAKKQKAEDAELTRILANVQTETREIEDEKDKLQPSLMALTESGVKAKQLYSEAQLELKVYLQKEQEEKAKLEQISKNYETVTRTLEERKIELDDLQTKVPQLALELQQTEKELEEVRREEPVVSARLQNQREKVEESRSSMQATRSRGRVLDSLMQEKSNGKLPGILGRLGDLGAIDLKYDVAVSTACNPLDNIVVDTVATAQACIEHLRRYDIGRATFIALDKQERWRTNCNTRIKTPEDVPRLFDLIRVQDEKVRTAFYFGLRDTLVAKDLEQATRIGYLPQRHRVVTLQGELIEPSGTMSGGGRTTLKGRMGRAVVATNITSPRDMQRMEARLQELDESARDLRRRQVTLTEKVARCTASLATMEMTRNKSSRDCKSLTEQLPGLKKQLQVQEKKVKETTRDPAEVKKIEAKVAAKKIEYDKAKRAAEKIEAEVKKLHAQITEITKGRPKAAQKKVDDLTEKINNICKEKTRLKVACNTATRNAQKSREQIKNMEQEVTDFEQKLLQMCAESKVIELKGGKMLGEIKQSELDLTKMEGELVVLQKGLSSTEKDEDKLKAAILDQEHKLQFIDKAIQDSLAHDAENRSQLKALKMQEVLGQGEVKQLPILNEDVLQEIDAKQLMYKISFMEIELGKSKPNLAAIEHFKRKEAQYLERVSELEQVTNLRNDMRNSHDDIRKKRTTEFMAGFSIITSKLKEMYQMITLGGDAELELVDSLDPFSEGIIFSVRPPKKSWKSISNLSGGEKTLSSLALVFALHYYKPTPLYVMDEIDAALDFKNVSIVGNYIKERTKNAQFIIISLRSNMFELADTLVGIYKTYNCTKSVTIRPHLYGLLEKVLSPPSRELEPILSQINTNSRPVPSTEEDLPRKSPHRRTSDINLAP